jgi:hypothetical protein
MRQARRLQGFALLLRTLQTLCIRLQVFLMTRQRLLQSSDLFLAKFNILCELNEVDLRTLTEINVVSSKLLFEFL